MTPGSDALDAVLARYGGIRVALVRAALDLLDRKRPGAFTADDVAEALFPAVRPRLTADDVRTIARALGYRGRRVESASPEKL